jgi:transcriptional regulator with XRE-family HTH domain
MTTKTQKTNHTLPQSVDTAFTLAPDASARNAYISALRAKGWTLQSIAKAANVTRETVRQIVLSDSGATPDLNVDQYPVPELPVVAVKAPPVYVEPSPEGLARLLELQPYAQAVRSNSKKNREEAEEYTALLNKEHTEGGVTLYRLAKRLGVTHAALRFRLARYGYKAPAEGATSRVYGAIKEENRVK